jgi:glycosyltransferase involved in cell wall biosynthesis
MAIPVLYVIPRMSIGGAQRHLLEVFRLIDRRRFTPMLCCLVTDRGDAGQLLDEVRALDVPIIDAGVRDVSNALGRPHTLGQIVRVAREMRRRRIGIVHSYLHHASVFGTLAARAARVPVAIVSKRSMDVYPRVRDRWAVRLVNGLADCVTAVAGAVGDHVHRTEHCPREKIVVIPNGVDPARITAGDAAGAPAIDRVAGGHVVGTIARLVWKRGYEELIEAAALLKQDEPDTRLVVVGDGPLRPALEEQARSLGLNGGVRFMGSVPRAARLLPQFDVFVLSSQLEGMSNGLLEAMAAGRPVVATAVGGNTEVVVDGDSGLLVPAKDPKALASAILRLLRDPELARRMGEAARLRVQTEFTLERMVQRMEQLYADLLKRRGIAA